MSAVTIGRLMGSARGWFVASGVCASVAVIGVVVNNWRPKTIFGRTTSGGHEVRVAYGSRGKNCVADLVPVDVAEVEGTAGNFFDVLSAAYPEAGGWSFESAVNPLSKGAIEVQTYSVFAAAWEVGAEFHVEYVPGPGDPQTDIHWIQVVTDNCNMTDNVGHGNAENVVDVDSTVATTPYYDDGFAADSAGDCPGNDGCDFYDRPRRGDVWNDHTWDAVTYLVQGPAVGAGAGLIRLLHPGFSWGWKNVCQDPPSLFDYLSTVFGVVIFNSCCPIEPGATPDFSAALPATMTLTKGTTSAQVSLLEANLSIAIDSEVDPSGGGGSTFNVTGGGGQFQTYVFGSEVVGTSTFTVLDGGGLIHWASGTISSQMTIRVSAPGFPDITADATGTGRIDFGSGTITLDPDSLGLEFHATIPAVSIWGLMIMALLLLVAGLFVAWRRRLAQA